MLERYDSRINEINSKISELDNIGFNLKEMLLDIDQVDSNIKKQSDSNIDSIDKIYNDAFLELDKIEKKQDNYYKIYELTEEIEEKIKSKKYDINSLITDTLTILQLIREGKIIISREDRYLLEKTFKTIYEVLKIAFVYGKGNLLFNEIKKNKELVPYINDQIKNDIDNIKNKEYHEDINIIKKGKKIDDNQLFDEDILLSIAIIKSDTIDYKEKDLKVDEVVHRVDEDSIEVLDVEDEKVLVKERKIEKENNNIDKIVGIGLITSSVLNNSKFDKDKSEELVIGDEKIVVNEYKDNSKDDYSEYGKYDYDEVDDYKDLYQLIDDDDKFYYEDDKKEKIDLKRLPNKLNNEIGDLKDMNKNMLDLLPALLGTTVIAANMAIMCAMLGAQGVSRIVNFVGHQLNNGLTNPKVLNMLPKNIGNGIF